MLNRYLWPLRGLVLGCALVTFFLTASAHAQTGRFIWQTQIGSAAEEVSLNQMIRCSRGGYVVVGGIRDTTVVFLQRRTFAAKLNEQGVVVWRTILGTGGPNSVAENRSGQLLIASMLGTYTGPIGDSDAQLDLLDPNGQPVWSSPYRSAQLDAIYGLQTANDGQLVGCADLLGAKTVFKMDSLGADIWRTTVPYDNASDGQIVNLLPVPGRGYVVSNYFYNNQTPFGFRGRLVSLNENGAEQTRRRAVFTGRRSAVTPAGDCLFASYQLTKTTAQGDSLWSVQYQYLGSAKAVYPRPDGRIAVLGEYYNPVFRATDLAIAELAPDGALLTDTIFTRHPSDEYALDLTADPAGNYVVCASTTRGTHGAAAGLVFKVRPFSRLLAAPADAGSGTLAGLELWPNPATTDQVQLRGRALAGATATLRDALGRVVRTYSFDATAADAPLSLAGLSPGLYLFTLTAAPTGGGLAIRTWRLIRQ